MKKYINGKIVEMTEADIAKREARNHNKSNVRKNASAQEARIKELEQIVSTLLTKLPKEE
jgi:hypothetical protein